MQHISYKETFKEPVEMLVNWQRSNRSIDELLSKPDYFAGIYSDQAFNWLLLIAYILGYVSCAGLAIVSWFERSGQAGPFRTVINQLASFQNDLVRLASYITFT